MEKQKTSKKQDICLILEWFLANELKANHKNGLLLTKLELMMG